jgi:hypothetical protein
LNSHFNPLFNFLVIIIAQHVAGKSTHVPLMSAYPSWAHERIPPTPSPPKVTRTDVMNVDKITSAWRWLRLPPNNLMARYKVPKPTTHHPSIPPEKQLESPAHPMAKTTNKTPLLTKLATFDRCVVLPSI